MVDHEEVLVRLGQVEESAKSAHKRIDEQRQLVESIRSIASSVESMQRQLISVQQDVDAIKEKPGKRWDLFLSTILSTTVGGFVGYLCALLLQGGAM